MRSFQFEVISKTSRFCSNGFSFSYEYRQTHSTLIRFWNDLKLKRPHLLPMNYMLSYMVIYEYVPLFHIMILFIGRRWGLFSLRSFQKRVKCAVMNSVLVIKTHKRTQHWLVFEMTSNWKDLIFSLFIYLSHLSYL